MHNEYLNIFFDNLSNLFDFHICLAEKTINKLIHLFNLKSWVRKRLNGIFWDLFVYVYINKYISQNILLKNMIYKCYKASKPVKKDLEILFCFVEISKQWFY